MFIPVLLCTRYSVTIAVLQDGKMGRLYCTRHCVSWLEGQVLRTFLNSFGPFAPRMPVTPGRKGPLGTEIPRSCVRVGRREVPMLKQDKGRQYPLLLIARKKWHSLTYFLLESLQYGIAIQGPTRVGGQPNLFRSLFVPFVNSKCWQGKAWRSP